MSKYMGSTFLALILLTGCKGESPKVVAAVPQAAPSPAASREVSFKGYKGLELKGKFLSGSTAKGPGVLLLPGSGPTDRDGNQAGLKVDILKSIAEKLASEGISSLRFDKRAVAATYGKSFPKDLAGLDDFFSWDAFVADASAAMDFLKSQPEIDPARTGILGHSEGGVIAVAAAKTAKPKALLLISTPGRDLGAVIIEQISQGYGTQLVDPAVLKKRVAETKRVVGAIQTTGKVPTDIPAELSPLFPAYAPSYLHSTFTFDPTTALATFGGPVLIVQGMNDVQVSPERDAPKLKEASKQSELFLVPGASHCLKASKGGMDPGFEGPVLPAALDKISSWAKSNL